VPLVKKIPNVFGVLIKPNAKMPLNSLCASTAAAILIVKNKPAAKAAQMFWDVLGVRKTMRAKLCRNVLISNLLKIHAFCSTAAN